MKLSVLGDLTWQFFTEISFFFIALAELNLEEQRCGVYVCSAGLDVRVGRYVRQVGPTWPLSFLHGDPVQKVRGIICIYEVCPEIIQPFWVSWEPFPWPWCNLAANQKRADCASINSHTPVGLVSRQWDAVGLACVMCDRRIHSDRASR
jgi:hypothetical protein